MIEWLKENWVQVGVIALAAHTLLKAIADAIDTEPEDESAFEKVVNVFGKIVGYLFGHRPN